MNFYTLLDLSPQSNILEILTKFKEKCLENPENIFYYTYALNILSNKIKKIFYDAALYHINIFNLYDYYEQNEYYKIDEYELIPLIEWLKDFKDFFYDTKYYKNNPQYHQLIEEWYDNMENIIIDIQDNFIHSFYLA